MMLIRKIVKIGGVILAVICSLAILYLLDVFTVKKRVSLNQLTQINDQFQIQLLYWEKDQNETILGLKVKSTPEYKARYKNVLENKNLLKDTPTFQISFHLEDENGNLLVKTDSTQAQRLPIDGSQNVEELYLWKMINLPEGNHTLVIDELVSLEIGELKPNADVISGNKKTYEIDQKWILPTPQRIDEGTKMAEQLKNNISQGRLDDVPLDIDSSVEVIERAWGSHDLWRNLTYWNRPEDGIVLVKDMGDACSVFRLEKLAISSDIMSRSIGLPDRYKKVTIEHIKKIFGRPDEYTEKAPNHYLDAKSYTYYIGKYKAQFITEKGKMISIQVSNPIAKITSNELKRT